VSPEPQIPGAGHAGCDGPPEVHGEAGPCREPPRSSAHRSALTHAGRSGCGARTFQPFRGLPAMVGRRREGGDGNRRESSARERAYSRARSGALRRKWCEAGRHVRTDAVRGGRGRFYGIGSLLDDGRGPWCCRISGVIVAGLACHVNAPRRRWCPGSQWNAPRQLQGSHHRRARFGPQRWRSISGPGQGMAVPTFAPRG
jgi:hypothetical protein